jgi:ribonuclease E
MPETDDTTPGTNPESPASTDETAAPRRRRRAASRPAGSPPASASAEVTDTAASPATAEAKDGGGPAAGSDGESAAPARARRRATRKATVPEGAPDESAAVDSADSAAPARAPRRATRKSAAPTTTPESESPAAAPEAAAEESEAPARTPRRRAARKATAPAAEAAPAAEEPAAPAAPAADEAAPARPRRRATRKATAPAGAPAVADAADEIVVDSAPAPAASTEEPAASAEDSAAPARPRRRATRKATAPAGAPAVADAAPVVVESAPAPAAASTEAPAAPAADEAAPTRGRRRAARKATAPAGPPAEAPEATTAAAAEEVAASAPAAEEAAPARGRRRAGRETAPAEAAAEDEPRGRNRRSAASGGGRRGKKGDTMVPTFSAGEGSRRLKPGALAPRSGAAPATAYSGKALRDGDGWGVEIDDAYEIRGYGETVEDATAEAAAALASAFGIPVESITIDVRADEAAPAAPAAEAVQAEEPAPTRGRRRANRPAVAVFQPPVFQAADQAAAAQTAPSAPAADETATADDEPDHEPDADATEDRTPRRRRRRRGGAPEQPAATPADEPEAESAQDTGADAEADSDDTDAEPDGEDRPSRRRRRGGRRRRRGDAADHEQDGEHDEHASDDEDEAHDEDDSEGADDHGDDENGGSASSRRRRRRRRRGSDAGDHEPSGTDDPERTVVKVREPRSPKLEGGTGVDEVQSIKGSTRLEAKKQRRREGREQGRRRVPIITEAEFLARREAVERVMVVRQNGDRTQIGVLEDNVLVEHYVNKEQATSYVGNVYLGKVQNVLPSMEAAFVDIGKGRNAVLYAGEVNFDALGHSGGPRRIEAALKSGQPVLVQVTKDPIGHKGARLTSQVSLPGRYLVYVPEGSMTGISRKLPDTERARLKTILKKIVPEDAGVIVRTAAEGASEDELRHDVERLQGQWEDITRKAKTGNAPTLLYGEPDMTVRVVRDIFNEDFSKVIVSGDEAWSTVHEYVSHVAPDLVERLSRWTPEVDVFANFRIDEQLLKALDRKVWLPSGGSLVIDKTEAMVVVDVNTGKFTGQGGNLEETVTRNNLEAAEEIVRQLRLRDLGGIVVVDFIDMVLESNRDLVMRRLLECLGRDRTKHQVAEVTSLGLVQMTRKRVGQGLLESFSETCVHCNGRGVIVHMDQATTTGGGGKRKRRRGGNGAAGEGHEHDHDVLAESEHGDEADEPGDELPELEPIEVGESELVPSVGDPEEEWFGSAAEAQAAANSPRGRGGRRRGARKATAPAGAPAAADREAEQSVVVVPVSEPDLDTAALTPAEPEPEAPVSAEPPARTRRRATRKVSAPAGSPTAAAEDTAVVVVPAEPAAATEEPEPEAPVSAEPPARTRRRATRKVSAPAGSATAAAEDAAVVVVPTAEAPQAAEAEGEPKKRAARKAPAKKAAAKKTAKKVATKKAAAKKTTTKKAATKKAASSAE